jgi:two-component system response regulator MprA
LSSRGARPSVKRILVAEDDASVRDALAELLALEEYQVTTAVDGLDALTLAIGDPPDLVVTDLQMPGLRGDVLIDRLRDAGLRMPVIIVTASSVAPAIKPECVVRKPFNVDELLSIVRDALIGAPLSHPSA